MSDRPDTGDTGSEYDPERVIVRDKRRLDPTTGAPRAGAATTPTPAAEPQPGSEPGSQPGSEPGSQPGSQPGSEPVVDAVAELTGDLQRLSAEYANYRKRVARDQASLQEYVTADVVSRLLPLLDDVDRAREHGDLEGAFKVVGDALVGIVAKLGVERFGEAGDAFDPQVHEAVMSAPEDPTTTVATCVQVFSPGYRTATGRVLRPAKVVVAEPGSAGGHVEAGHVEADIVDADVVESPVETSAGA